MIPLSKLFTEFQIFFAMTRNRNAILYRFRAWSASEAMSEPALSNQECLKDKPKSPQLLEANEFSMSRNQLISMSHLRCIFISLLAILRHYLAKTVSCITTRDWLPLVSSKCKQRSEHSVPRSFQMQLNYPISSRNWLRMSELSAFRLHSVLNKTINRPTASRHRFVHSYLIPPSADCSRILAKLEKIQTTNIYTATRTVRYLRAIAS